MSKFRVVHGKIFHKIQCMCHEVVVLTCTIHLCA